jgi:hypothetical protein
MRIPFFCTLLVLSALGIASGQDTKFPNGPQYVLNSGSPMFARSISTPSLSLTGPPLEAGASNATATLVPGAQNQTASPQPEPVANLFPVYYGAPPPSVIEISFPAYPFEPSFSQLPASILDTGVWQATTAQALRDRGYGLALGEAAAYRKAQTRHATHVYTNVDINRLRGGSQQER